MLKIGNEKSDGLSDAYVGVLRPNNNLTRQSQPLIENDFSGHWEIDETNIIKVRSNLKTGRDEDGDKIHYIALSERNEAHPNGEIFIADDLIHEVALTEKVVEKLQEGWLIEIK